MLYLLSFFTGILECGWLFVGNAAGLPLWGSLLFAVCYHLGNLFPLPFTLSKRALYAVGALSVISAAFSLLSTDNGSSVTAFAAQGIGVFLDSALIQSARSGLKSDGNRVFKRLCRVAGFLASPLAVLSPTAVIAVGAVLGLSAVCKADGSSARFTAMNAQRGFSVVMFFHQLHYFFYAHITFALAISIFGERAALGFALTWVTYLSVEPLLKERVRGLVPLFYIGHSFIAAALLALAFTEICELYLPFLIIWILAGFGGGTVFTITGINRTLGCFDRDSETIAENLGHIAGISAAALCAGIFGNGAPPLMAVAAAASALCAVTAMRACLGRLCLK